MKSGIDVHINTVAAVSACVLKAGDVIGVVAEPQLILQ